MITTGNGFAVHSPKDVTTAVVTGSGSAPTIRLAGSSA